MNKVVSWISNIRTFGKSVKEELRKTAWPSRNEVVGAVIIVCILTFVYAVILGSMDFFFNYLINKFIF